MSHHCFKFKNILFKTNSCKYILIKRNSSDEVRVRFAPSPTGKLHIGGLRTALYNYLFAKKHNGKFILRIEDTDRERLQLDSLDNIISSLKWAGIEPDYGPHVQKPDDIEQGGPWIQSSRLDLYQTSVKILLEKKLAYKCFCDETRLVLLRRNAAARQEKIGYDGKCRNLPDDVIEKYIQEGKNYVIRFKLDEKEFVYDDLSTGKHSSNPGKQEGDFIIIKSDGYPTYHFANVVDDYNMRISHVLRGQEWQLSTAKHIAIYEAFGWKYPKFAHLPLICNNDGTKISKRQNDISVMWYKEKGYLPETLLTYLSSIGGGLKKNVYEGELVFTNFATIKNDLVDNFDEKRIISRSVKLNQELLEFLNKSFIRLKMNSQLVNDKKELISWLRSILELKTKDNKDFKLNRNYLNDEYLWSVLKWAQERVKTLNDLVDDLNYSFLWSDISNYSIDELGEENLLKISQLLKSLSLFIENPLSSDYFKDPVKLKKELTNIFNKIKKDTKDSRAPISDKKPKGSNYWELTRLLISGSLNGPPVIEMFNLLGKENVLYRLNVAKDYFIK